MMTLKEHDDPDRTITSLATELYLQTANNANTDGSDYIKSRSLQACDFTVTIEWIAVLSSKTKNLFALSWPFRAIIWLRERTDPWLSQ